MSTCHHVTQLLDLQAQLTDRIWDKQQQITHHTDTLTAAGIAACA